MICWDSSMNTSDTIQSHNDNPARIRPHNDTFIPNYYPVNMGMQPFIYNYHSHVVMNTNGAYPAVNNSIESNSDQSGMLSPNIDGNVDRPIYHIVQWQDIADKYEGNEQRPNCGRLNNNVYFTERSASSDKYMVFDSKSDYINNFVNYYFSDKNLAIDHKLVALMDDKGIIALSALIKFPKLRQVDSTTEDLVKAFQNNNFVMSVELMNGEKGAKRRDNWCPSPSSNNSKVDSEMSSNVSDHLVSESSHNELIPTVQNSQIFYIPSIIPQSLYTQPAGMMPNTGNIGPIASYPSYAYMPINNSFQNNPANLAALNTQHNQAPLIWQIQTSDYGNANMLQQMPHYRYSAQTGEMSGNRLN